MPFKYEEMAERVVRSYKRIPTPGYPNSTQDDVWDAYLDFFSNAYHLKEWIVNDTELSITNKEMNSFIEKNHNMKLLQAIVTQSKHLIATHDHIKYQDINVYWDDGIPRSSPAIRYQEQDFLLAEDSDSLLTEKGEKIILDNPRQEIHPRRLALKVLIAWNKFFVEKKLKGSFAIE